MVLYATFNNISFIKTVAVSFMIGRKKSFDTRSVPVSSLKKKNLPRNFNKNIIYLLYAKFTNIGPF
jgi:hypothetical protein